MMNETFKQDLKKRITMNKNLNTEISGNSRLGLSYCNIQIKKELKNDE